MSGPPLSGTSRIHAGCRAMSTPRSNLAHGVPADVAWGDGGETAQTIRQEAPSGPSEERLAEVAQSLRAGGRAALLLGGRALGADALRRAGGIAARAGTRLFAEVFPTRVERGVGLPAVERLAYVPEFASVQLRGLKHLVLLDAKAPVSFFAYPGRDSDLVPDGCEVHELASPGADVLEALDGLLAALGPGGAEPAVQAPSKPAPPTGSLTAEKVCQAIAAALPEGAIISDESQTSGVSLYADTAGAPRHDLLALTGGAIGQGLPVAVGAAVACPDRSVFALEADGSALYTIQSLWTMAREQLDVTVVIFNNRSYAILNLELARVGAKNAGPEAKAQLDLSRPNIDFVELGSAFGVPSRWVENAEELVSAIEHALAEPGPHLIEARVPSTLTAAQLRAMPYALKALGALPAPLAARVKDRFYP